VELKQRSQNAEIRELDFRIPFCSQRVDFDHQDLEGFNSRADAEHWQERGCGIACLRMVLAAFYERRGDRFIVSYGELVSQGVSLGAYCDRGWTHAGLVDLAQQYGVFGEAHRHASIREIAAAIDRGEPCIASVTVKFQGGNLDEGGRVRQPGGHLVVVMGYAVNEGDIVAMLVHHPSSGSANWQRRLISAGEFTRSFAESFMSFRSRKDR
jgi:hypothetical protein